MEAEQHLQEKSPQFSLLQWLNNELCVQKGLMYVEAEISTGEDGVERLIDTLSLIG